MARLLIMACLMATAIALTSATMAAAANLNVHSNNPPHLRSGATDPMLKAQLQSVAASISNKIKHIVVLMMENRSFDHLFGFYGKNGVNGLTGKEYNLENPADPSSKKIYVSTNAPFVNECDPSHSYPGTMEKLYGNKTAAEACDFKCVNMGGFIHEEHKYKNDDWCNVMQSVDNKEKLPVMTTLADEFALMDRFFCSVPGPTWPNRLFHQTATSNGDTETSHWYLDIEKNLYPQKTFFDQVTEAGAEWKIYYNDTPWEMFIETIAHNPEHLHKMTQFYEDAAAGTLPDYCFINPLHGSDENLGGCNDHHPDHDLRPGEAYYKDIYEALRASPKWNETLFVLTYDEHGGFHDHVHPPTKVPPPVEGIVSYPDAGFKFDRLGVRIPTLLISPWVPKGLVIGRAPDAQRPQPDSEYDLTSIMATSRKLLKKLNGVGNLTARDGWASTYEHVFSMLDQPRTDCPMHLPTPGMPMPAAVKAESELPPNGLQAEILTINHYLAEPDTEVLYPAHITKQSQVGKYSQKAFEKHRARTLRWKAGKGRLSAAVIASEKVAKARVSPLHMAPVATSDAAPLTQAWTITTDPKKKVSHVTINNGDKAEPLCFDVNDAIASATIKVNHCYPTANPRRNRDKLQWWTIVEADQTIRPATATHLCVTHAGAGLVLAECSAAAAASQQFTFSGEAGAIALADGNVISTAH